MGPLLHPSGKMAAVTATAAAPKIPARTVKPSHVGSPRNADGEGALGAGWTTMVADAFAVTPTASAKRIMTLNEPEIEYVCTATDEFEVLPSPKLHNRV